MLLCQKMKLQREENRLTLEQMRFSSKVDRMEKKVGKRQKYYDKLKKQIERQANYYKNNANMFFSNMAGLGTNSVNLNNPYGSNGAVMKFLSGLNADSINQICGLKEGDKGYITNENIVKAIQSGCAQVNNSDKELDFNGNKIPAKALYNSITGEVYAQDADAQSISGVYQQVQQYAQMQVSNMQSQANQMKVNYENNVSIWLEAQTEQLEAQEEWEMDLLAEEQADMEADKNMVEAKLKRVQQEKQNIEQALGQAIQDSAPKFGLG